MGRIRTIKPEFWANEKLSSISEPALILAAALLNYADDYGYFNANPKLITAACFPIREPSVNIHGMLSELSNIGYIELRNTDDGRTWGKVVNFDIHQRVNRPSESKIEPIFNNSVNIHGMLSESSVNDHCRNREQGTGNREGIPPKSPKGEARTNGELFKPPTIEQCKQYAPLIKLSESEAERFWYHGESNGWKVGRNPMKSWKAAMVTWRDSPFRKEPVSTKASRPPKMTPDEIRERFGN